MSATKSYKEEDAGRFFGDLYDLYNAVMLSGCALILLALRPLAVFMFRNRIGLGLAIDALKEGFAKHLFTIDELVRHANTNRVTKIMTPYMESLFA